MMEVLAVNLGARAALFTPLPTMTVMVLVPMPAMFMTMMSSQLTLILVVFYRVLAAISDLVVESIFRRLANVLAK
jgi:hypothetical protein